jgi:hypothetical protein
VSISAVLRTYELKLPAIEKFLLVTMADHGFSNIPTLASACGMSQARAVKALAKLSVKGLLHIDGQDVHFIREEND